VAEAAERTDGVVILVYANHEKDSFHKFFQKRVFPRIIFKRESTTPSQIPLKRNRRPLQTMVWRGNH
jgi:hypothetical protein